MRRVPPGTDVGRFVAQAPKFLLHSYGRCLKLLIHTVGLSQGLRNLLACWRKKRQLLAEATVKHVLSWPDPGWQLLENQLLFSLYWGLTCIFRGTVEHYQRAVAKTGTQEIVMIQPGIQTTSKNMVVEAETQTTGVNTMAEIGTQTPPPGMALEVKKTQRTRR